MKNKFYLNIILIIAILFILGCESISTSNLPFGKKDKEDPVTKDLSEFKKSFGGVNINLIVRPGKDRIAVEKPINIALEFENNEKEDIKGTYSLIDTPGDVFGGIQGGGLSSSFLVENGQKDIIAEDSITYNEQLRETQFVANINFDDKTEFIVPNICIKNEIDKNVGISCPSETSEKGSSSNSPVKISKAEKLLVDNNFDGRVDELLLKFGLSIDSNCELDKNSLNVESLDAAGINGFECKHNEEAKRLDCSAPSTIGQEFVEGPLNLVLAYKCKVTLSTGSIKLNRPNEVL